MNKKTQKFIAEKSRITQGYLSKILSGSANPTVSTLNNIAEAYGISVSALLKKIEANKKAAA